MTEQRKTMDITSTYKSQDTEEWLDIHFTRPIGFWWAKFFDRFDIHPNVVTILSIFLGVAAGIMFYFTDFTSNLIGVLLLMWANFYDSADGQLARMTGKKTHWGRMLDGFAGDLWFITIYFFVCLRLYTQPIPGTETTWRLWIFVVGAVSGILCHSRQCQLADYYRNIHLFFLKGEEGSELDNSEQQKALLGATPKAGNFWWRAFLNGYVSYTKKQEQMTPEFQLLIHYIRDTRGGKIPKQFSEDFRKKSLPLMKYANILTFNCRAITLYVSCLINLPWIYFLVELTVFSALAAYMHAHHERICRNFLKALKDPDGPYPA